VFGTDRIQASFVYNYLLDISLLISRLKQYRIMKRSILFILSTIVITSVYAQTELRVYGERPKPKDRIQGVVRDSVHPVSYAIVVEMNYRNNEVAYTIADHDGNFSLRIVNPSDSIEIRSQGYYKIQIPITNSHYDVVLQRDPVTYKEPSPSDTILRDRTGYITDEIHPLLILDDHTVKTQNANWNNFEYNKDAYNKKEIAILFGIDADRIKEIKVLTGKAATKEWGPRAKNGSIEVWTK